MMMVALAVIEPVFGTVQSGLIVAVPVPNNFEEESSSKRY
jgi:hypothetical protein